MHLQIKYTKDHISIMDGNVEAAIIPIQSTPEQTLKYAELFCAAPNMLEVLRELADHCNQQKFETTVCLIERNKVELLNAFLLTFKKN